MARVDIFAEKKDFATSMKKTGKKISDITKRSIEYSISETNFSATSPTMRFLTPFALAMNATASMIGILYTLPIFIGSTFQLGFINLLSKIKDRKKLLTILTILQNISWLPIVLLPFFAFGNLKLLIIFASINAIIYSMASPIWNSLVGDLIPIYKRGKFFGSKNITSGLWAFIGTIGAGLLLTVLEDKIFLAFSIIFVIAILWRISTHKEKVRIEEPGYNPQLCDKFTIRQFIEKSGNTNYGLFVKYASFMEFAINLSKPFIAYYMLAILKFDYLTFAFIISASIVASFASTTIWGKYIDNLGSVKTIYISGFILPLVPIIWVFSTSPAMFVIAEIISGIALIGFKMSSSVFILDSVKKQNTIKSTSYYNFFTGIGTFLGGSLGAIALLFLDSLLEIKTILITLLFISAGLQLFFTLRFASQLNESRFVRISFCKQKFYNPFKKDDAIVIKPQYE